MRRIVFTICSNNYLPQAKILGDTLKAVSPDTMFVVGLVDQKDPNVDYDVIMPAPFRVIRYDEIGFPFFSEMLAKYDVVEFNTAVKPYFFEYIFNKFNADKIYYIDPDIAMYDGLGVLDQILESNNIVLTPMITVANEEVSTDELVALRHGMYNLGFIGVKNCAESMRFIRWWQQRLRNHCVIDKPRGLFVDQKWIDIAPLFFKGVYILSDPGYNMAWWNMSERRLVTKNGRYYVNAESSPLVFFHFSGFKPGSGTYFGRVNMPEYSFDARPDVLGIFSEYAKMLEQNDYLRYWKLKPLIRFADKDKMKPKTMRSRIRKSVKRLLGV